MNNTTYNIQYQTWQPIIYRLQGIIIITMNLVIMLLILRIKQLRKCHSNIFLSQLLFSHVLVGLEELLDSFIRHFPRDHLVRFIDRYAYTGLYMFQCMNMSVMTLDRMTAIKWPYMYLSVTRSNALFIMGITWFVTMVFIISLITVTASEYIHLIMRVSITGVSILFLSTCNFLIYRIVLRHLCIIRSTTVKLFVKKRDSKGNEQEETKTKPTKTFRTQESLFRSTLVCLVIVLSFVLCYVPVLISNILILGSITYFSTIGPVLYIIAYCNSIFDPVTYVLLNKDVKKEFRKIRRYLC